MHSKGFTLIELLITVAVLAVLLGLAVPSFRTLLLNNRLQSTRMEFVAAFTLAKSEASKRGLPVYVTALGATSGNEFVGGWKVWVDTDGSGAQNGAEPTVRQHEAYSSPIVITTDLGGTGTSFTQAGFNSQGFLIGATTQTLTICDGRTGVQGGRITLTPAGTIDLKEDYTC